jgi:hypothetical protein
MIYRWEISGAGAFGSAQGKARRRGRLRSTNVENATAEGRSTPANAKSAFAGDPGAVPHEYR